MARLRIPQEHRQAVSILSHLANADVEAFAEALARATVSMQGIRATVGDFFPDANADDVTGALVSLVLVTETSPELTPDIVNQEIRETLGADAGTANLAPLLDSQALLSLAKTIDLRTTHERILRDFRIVTDMRPIFGNDMDQPLESAIVTHVARLTYGTASGVEELFVALTHKDLTDMQEALERALIKEQRAHDFIETRGGQVFDKESE